MKPDLAGLVSPLNMENHLVHESSEEAINSLSGDRPSPGREREKKPVRLAVVSEFGTP